jgi:hypothetical protein
VAAANPAPQLVELGQAKAVRVVNHHGVGVGHIEPGLHDHGRDQDVHLAGHEAAHDLLQLVRRHLAVGHSDPGPRGQGAHLGSHGVDRLDPIVYREHLSAAIDLAGKGLFQKRVVPGLHEGENG